MDVGENAYDHCSAVFRRSFVVFIKCRQSSHNVLYYAFFHHYQGSIDFNTVNVNRTVGMYSLVSTGNRGDIE